MSVLCARLPVTNFNEVFFDEAIVDDADLIGSEGNGWAVTQTTLLFERTGIGAGGAMAGFPYPGPKSGIIGRTAGDAAAIAPPAGGASVVTLPQLIDLARRMGRTNDPHIRQKLARLASIVNTGGWTAQRARRWARPPAKEGSPTWARCSRPRS